ncbi:MAG: hypothetical protein QOI57_2778 [Rubrobacteraceae bacterium]|jgi:hypothetical protein|nr:hypothetical protein [Rubrobacteraceae bacterium]
MSKKTEPSAIRILLAFEYKHTTYMDAVRTAVRGSHPQAQVLAIDPGALEAEMDRFDPHVLVCELPAPENPCNNLPACIELAIDPSQPFRFRVGQRRWESLNPGLAELIAIVADTDQTSP